MSEWLGEEYEMKHKRFNKENVPLSARFKTEKQLEVAAQGITPTNTKLANDWAVKNFTTWINFRNTVI